MKRAAPAHEADDGAKRTAILSSGRRWKGLPVPGWFQEESADAFSRLSMRDDDVIICSLPKGGTTWMHSAPREANPRRPMRIGLFHPSYVATYAPQVSCGTCSKVSTTMGLAVADAGAAERRWEHGLLPGHVAQRGGAGVRADEPLANPISVTLYTRAHNVYPAVC